MSTTITEIAARLNISPMTVSRALNNKPAVKKETGEAVLKLANKLGYRPNIVAQSLVRGKTHTIGVIIPDIRYSFFPDITFSIQNVLDKVGYGIVLCNSQENEETEAKQINMLLSRRVDGLIIAPAQNPHDLQKYKRLESHKISCVFIDRYLKGINISSVIYDDMGGAFKATEYLIKLGHRRIAFISGPPHTSTSDNRRRGFEKAMQRYKVPLNGKFLFPGNFAQTDGYAAAKEILVQKEKPTAFFVVNDVVASGVYTLFKEKKVRIPHKISVIGFADLDFASMLNPPLTTVCQSKDEMGKIAAEYILRMIEGKKYALRRKTLPTELIIRESCCPPFKEGGNRYA